MNILKKYWRSIATQFIPQMLCATVKNKIKTFVERFERKPLNLDFNMNDYFTEKGRVRENRQRLRELYDQYKRIENYYPIFLAYFTAIGIFIFDLIAFGVNHTELCYYNFITLLTVSAFIYTCYLIWNVFKGNKWTHDYLPKDVCEDYDSDIIKDFPELKKGTPEFQDDIIRRYRISLDRFVLNNFKTYQAKTIKLNKVWKPLIVSLILLSLNVITYKTIKMEKLQEEPEERLTVENVNKLDDAFTPEEIKKIKEIVHDEFLKLKNGELNGELILKNIQNKK